MQVLSSEKKRSWSYYHLACFYSVTNKSEESLTYLNQAFQKGFNDWEHIEKKQ
jgi:hypothetical protein